jgi:hypothetical protein
MTVFTNHRFINLHHLAKDVKILHITDLDAQFQHIFCQSKIYPGVRVQCHFLMLSWSDSWYVWINILFCFLFWSSVLQGVKSILPCQNRTERVQNSLKILSPPLTFETFWVKESHDRDWTGPKYLARCYFESTNVNIKELHCLAGWTCAHFYNTQPQPIKIVAVFMCWKSYNKLHELNNTKNIECTTAAKKEMFPVVC